MRTFLLAATAALALAGCGGGSGGGGGAIDELVQPSPVALRLSQDRILSTIFQGQQKFYSFVATVDRQPDPDQPYYTDSAYISIRDTADAMSPNPSMNWNGDHTFTARASSRSGLALGRYRGELRVRLCPDQACTTVFTEKAVPYDFNIVSDAGSNLKPLAPFDNAGEWTTGQRDAAHSGFVPVTLDATQFSYRWLWSAKDISGELTAIDVPITDSATGMGYSMTGGSDGQRRLIAFRESDHSEVWSASFSNNPYLSSATLADGRILLAYLDDSSSRLLALDALTGAEVFNTAAAEKVYGGPSAPVASGDAIFVNFGGLGGVPARDGRIVAFSAADGHHLWTSATGGQSGVAPAVDGQHVYFYRPNSSYSSNFPDGFTAINRADGSTAFTHVRPGVGPGEAQQYYNGDSPVLDGAGVLVNGSHGGSSSFIYRYDLATRAPAWEILGSFNPGPVVAGDTVYVGQQGPARLQARRLSDGALLWSWSPPNDGNGAYTLYSLLATQNLVFLSTNEQVYAIDVASHLPVWTYPMPGALSLSSSGLLYIRRISDRSSSSGPDGKLAAINLR